MLKNLYQMYFGIQAFHNTKKINQLFHEIVTQIAKVTKNQLQTLNLHFTPLTLQQCDLYASKALLHKQANKHSQYTQTLPEIEQPNQMFQKCQCCGYSTGIKLSMWISEQQMYFLGPGILLYYYYLRVIIYLSTLVLLIFGLNAIISNSIRKSPYFLQKQCHEVVFWCFFQIYFNIYNYKLDSFQLEVQSFIGLILTIFLFIAIQIFRLIGTQKQKKFDDGLFSPSDLTLKLQHLPQGQYTESELMQIIMNKATQMELNVQIQKIYMIYDCHEFENWTMKLKRLSLEIADIIQNEQKTKEDQIILQRLKHQFFSILKQIEDLKVDFIRKTDFRTAYLTHTALIQFKTQQMTKIFYQFFKTQNKGLVSRLISSIKNNNQTNNKNLIFIKDHLIEVDRAPQPEDIIWENFKYKRDWKLSIGIWVATIFIIISGFAVIFGLLFLEMIYQKYNANLNKYAETLISFVVAVATVFINKILNFCLQMTIDQQKHYTKSERTIALTQKIVIAQFINVIIIPILSQYVLQKNSMPMLLAKLAFNYSIINSFGLNIISLIDPKSILKEIVTRIICIRNKIITYYSANQYHQQRNYIKGLNKFYQSQELDISTSYAYCIGSMLHMSFFFFQEPFIIVFTILGLSMNYLFKKYFLVNRYRIPNMISKQVFEATMHMLKYMPITYGAGALVSLREFGPIEKYMNSYIITCFVLIIGFIGIIDPGKLIHKSINKLQPWFVSKKVQEQKKQIEQNFKFNKNYEQYNQIYKLLAYDEILPNYQVSNSTKQVIDEFYSQFKLKILKKKKQSQGFYVPLTPQTQNQL